MAFGPMPVDGLFPIEIHVGQVTADVSAAGTTPVPRNCQIHGIALKAHSLFGGTVPTDLDLVVKNATKNETILASTALVDASAITPVSTSPIAGTADLDAEDLIEVETDITGGATSPGVNGVAVTLWCSPRA